MSEDRGQGVCCLPDDAGDRLVVFAFPGEGPEVRIRDLADEAPAVRCVDAGGAFVPLVEHGACDWCIYERPGGQLWGIVEDRVVGVARYAERTIFRVWDRCSNPQRPEVGQWTENHAVVEDDAWRWIRLERDASDRLVLGQYHYFGNDRRAAAEPEPLSLKVGQRWERCDGGSRVVGVVEVEVGERFWKCLKVVTTCRQRATADGTPAGLASMPVALVHRYVADTGRTVLLRRFNGVGYTGAENPRSFESLAGELEESFQGDVFRHQCDIVPDIALEKALDK